MRTHEFTFKKTVKRVNEFNAISVDLTVQDARELLNTIRFADEAMRGFGGGLTESLEDLHDALELFLGKHE